MSLWERLTHPGGAPAAPKRRRAVRTPADDRIALENRALRHYEKRNPEKFDEILLTRAGFLAEPPLPKTERERDPLDVTMSVLERLKKYGMLKENPAEMGETDPNRSMPDWMQFALAIFGSSPVLQAGVARAMGIAVPSTTVTVEGQVGESLAMNPAPAQLSAPAPALTPTLTHAIEREQPAVVNSEAGGATMGMADFAIMKLGGLNPTDAARWILGFTNTPEKRAMAALLCERPDDQIPITLDELRTAQPEFAGLVTWLVSRPDWTILVVHAMREISGINVLAPETVAIGAADDGWAGI